MFCPKPSPFSLSCGRTLPITKLSMNFFTLPCISYFCGPLRVEVVHDNLRAVELVPLVGAEGADEGHAERVRLGEDVHVTEVSANM